MRKSLIFLIFFVFGISLVSAFSNQIALGSIVSADDLSQINTNLNHVKDNYGISVEFVILNSSNSLTGESLQYFGIYHLDAGGAMKTWNLLVYYNVWQNQIKFVTYSRCGFELSKLEELKAEPFIQKVLSENSPSTEDLSAMFVGISKDIRSFADYYKPDESTCSQSSENGLVLRSNEYSVPNDVLRAIYSVTMNEKWELSNPAGMYVDQNYLPSSLFDFLGANSKKKQFENLLKEKTSFSDSQIKNYYSILTTPGNIVLEQNYDDSELFHERTHEIMTQVLSDSERQTLKNARAGFFDILDAHSDNSAALGPMAGFTAMSIRLGNWQELYAYMAQYQRYPQSETWQQYIDSSVYDLFRKNYPNAYAIYQKIYNLASD